MATIDHLILNVAVGNNLGPGVETRARGPALTRYMNDPNKHLIEIRTYD